MNDLTVDETPIPGLLVVRLPVHGDERGWFKENWQRAKMIAAGLPDFGPVQNNISYNATRGTTRGIHAEPWDKLISVATGRAFAAWVDLRPGASFGTTFWLEVGPEIAVFVPRGVGNSYQALVDDTVYTYLVNDHWCPGVAYAALALDDPEAAIPWPIPLAQAELSAKDRANPRLADVTPMAPRRTLILGGAGQVGRALATAFPDAELATREALDVCDEGSLRSWDWRSYDVVVNAAAYTAVDAAETPLGRTRAWAANATAVATLAGLCREYGVTLVHYSTDYVFDGTAAEHPEEEPLSPLSMYGATKAAGELAARSVPRHYVLRTSWVVGEGRNFVRTMADLAQRGAAPSVVADQVGRLTFASTLAAATRHLLESDAAYGVYNVTNSGPPLSWHEVAQEVFALRGRDRDDVTATTTAEYVAAQIGAGKVIAERPRSSVLPLDRLERTGFIPQDQLSALRSYLS